ncbi:MAG: PIG-L deacetylase family protein [Myxococcota bacterium]|jgi:LmbE family N-acetylglucosaminyl deacetylase
MDRRDFLKTSAAAGAAALLPSFLASCAKAPIRPDGSPEPVPIDAFLQQGARTMWIAAHPDDECFAGTIMARSRLYYGNPLYMLVMTQGDGGECCRPEGCEPDLATVRKAEMGRVAKLYGSELQMESYFNAKLPVSSFPKRHEIYKLWQDHKEPVDVTVEAIRRFKPDLVLTFTPDKGATGHPEHQLASRIATTAIRLANDPAYVNGQATHKVTRTYNLVAKFWLLSLIGQGDPGPVTEVFDATLPATDGLSCLDFMAYATELHRTQARDMGMVRRMKVGFQTLSLRQTDPFTHIFDPAEVAL